MKYEIYYLYSLQKGTIQQMKSMIKKLVPQRLLERRTDWIKEKRMKKLLKQDHERFLKYSFGKEKLNYSQLEARLTKEYHSIEKGLSYKNLRLGFGKQVLQNVIDLMIEYRRQGHTLEAEVYQTALSNLKKYIDIHEENNYDVSELKETFRTLEKGVNYGETGGVYCETRKEVEEKSKGDFETFSLSRHSVRDYSGKSVSYDILEDVFQLANHTPSACNRQSWKVRVVENSKLKKEIQKNQNGNRGFGDYIDKFIIITGDVQYYDRLRERNQANIDGGMYAMNLLYALHYYNIAAVPLSASLSLIQEKNLRKTFEIPDSENFIMFIGIGNYVEEFKVPKSDRRKVKYNRY